MEKSVINERTYASARELNKKEKILELAEMLGNNESETLANAAAELLTNATSTKNN